MHAERISLRGRVQGVGMRPVLYRLASARSLHGSIRNSGEGVELRLCGNKAALDDLFVALRQELPPLARLDHIAREIIPVAEDWPQGLTIESSDCTGNAAVVLPDAAMCKACLREMRDPQAVRYRYPFTSCTHCGPRLSIQQRIPWDRSLTSMAAFPLCGYCRGQYEDPADRRYHAQPIACPACGPQCRLVDRGGRELATGDAAIVAAQGALRAGRILALKGPGGFHLACDARSESSLSRLRQRKQRPSKPFAIMGCDYPQLKQYVALSTDARAALQSPAAPIVIVPRGDSGVAGGRLPESLAPGLGQLAVMLPSTGLQHLLLQDLGFPLVMTSGNAAGAPPCTDEPQALEALAPIADVFLLHDQPIANRLDDSLLQLDASGRARVLRLGRGLAPLQRCHVRPSQSRVLALGAQMKSSFALLREQDWIVSQHIGDLEHPSNLEDLEQGLSRYMHLYQFQPEVIAVDAHPAYLSHQLGQRLAQQWGLPIRAVQHHHAHAVAALAEHEQWRSLPCLAVCFDGLGYHDSGALWGGEFLRVELQSYQRLGRWRPAALPGGAAAIRQPGRNLYAVIEQLGGWEDFCRLYPRLSQRLEWPAAPQQLQAMLQARLNSPECSAVGRSFDAMASLLRLAPQQLSYEAEAAMRLQAAQGKASAAPYPVTLVQGAELWELDWRGLWRQAFEDAEAERPVSEIAVAFHAGLAHAVGELSAILVSQQDLPRQVVVTGGVFQNLDFAQLVENELAQQGLQALQAQEVPCNDGGLALGQAFIAAAQMDCA